MKVIQVSYESRSLAFYAPLLAELPGHAKPWKHWIFPPRATLQGDFP